MQRAMEAAVEIYLMRHGITAEGMSGKWRTDDERPLGDNGIRETEREARGLAAAKIGFDRIFSSPLVRARQTATIIAEGQAANAGPDLEVEEIAALAPGLIPDGLVREVARLLRERGGTAPAIGDRSAGGTRSGGVSRPGHGQAAAQATAARPGSDSPGAGRPADAQRRAARVLLVGHEPDMGRLAAWLLDLPDGHSIPFGRGTIARIDVDSLPPTGAGRLAWLLTASMAGLLASG